MNTNHTGLTLQWKSDFHGELHDVSPLALLEMYPISEVERMAICFCLDAASEPAVFFSIYGFKDYTVPLEKLPNRLIMKLGISVADPQHVFDRWLSDFCGGEDGEAGQGAAITIPPLTPPPNKAANALPLGENDLYRQEIVGFLRYFCDIDLTDGSRVVDCPIFCSLYRGHKVLHGLRDVYPWSRIHNVTGLSEERAVREAEKLGIYGRRGLMPLVFDLFAPYRGQRVVVITKTSINQDVKTYGDVKLRKSPSGIFEIGETELTYDRVVFMALVTEVEAMNKRERDTHK